MIVALKFPLGVATVTLLKPDPGGPEMGLAVGVGVLVGKGVGFGVDVGARVIVGNGVSVGKIIGVAVGSIIEEVFCILVKLGEFFKMNKPPIASKDKILTKPTIA